MSLPRPRGKSSILIGRVITTRIGERMAGAKVRPLDETGYRIAGKAREIKPHVALC